MQAVTRSVTDVLLKVDFSTHIEAGVKAVGQAIPAGLGTAQSAFGEVLSQIAAVEQPLLKHAAWDFAPVQPYLDEGENKPAPCSCLDQ